MIVKLANEVESINMSFIDQFVVFEELHNCSQNKDMMRVHTLSHT